MELQTYYINVKIGTNVPIGGAFMQWLFLDSIENKEKIMIYYVDQENNITQRFIRVIRINEGSIVAYCYWRKQVRTFSLENILSAGSIYRHAGA